MDAPKRALLERIELLPVNRVHRAAARVHLVRAERSAERVAGWLERLRAIISYRGAPGTHLEHGGHGGKATSKA